MSAKSGGGYGGTKMLELAVREYRARRFKAVANVWGALEAKLAKHLDKFRGAAGVNGRFADPDEATRVFERLVRKGVSKLLLRSTSWPRR